MDVQMPVMDGLEATHEILEFEQEEGIKHTPIIAVTANVLKGDRERFLGAGMDEYISKPISKDALLKMLERVAHGDFNQDYDEASTDESEALTNENLTQNEDLTTKNENTTNLTDKKTKTLTTETKQSDKIEKTNASAVILATTSPFLSSYIKHIINDIITVENLEKLSKALSVSKHAIIMIDENFDEEHGINSLVNELKKLKPKKIIVLGDEEIKNADLTLTDLQPEAIQNAIEG
jgi:response regulator RpfG family c-di-GMP phosphodiesterase